MSRMSAPGGCGSHLMWCLLFRCLARRLLAPSAVHGRHLMAHVTCEGVHGNLCPQYKTQDLTTHTPVAGPPSDFPPPPHHERP